MIPIYVASVWLRRWRHYKYYSIYRDNTKLRVHVYTADGACKEMKECVRSRPSCDGRVRAVRRPYEGVCGSLRVTPTSCNHFLMKHDHHLSVIEDCLWGTTIMQAPLKRYDKTRLSSVSSHNSTVWLSDSGLPLNVSLNVTNIRELNHLITGCQCLAACPVIWRHSTSI